MDKENEDQEQLLTKLFAKAKGEHPRVKLEDMKKLIAVHATASVGTNMFSRIKFWFTGGLLIFIGVVSYYVYQQYSYTSDAIQPTPMSAELQKGLNSEIRTNTNIDITNSSSENSTVPNAINKEQLTHILNASVQKDNQIKGQKEDYYLQGDAKINFESEGANVFMVIGEKLERLEINGTVISETEYAKFNELIQKGMALKAEADKSSAPKTDSEIIKQQKNRLIINELIRQLQDDKMIDDAGHFELRITGSQLFVNGTEQSEAMFVQYKNLYETASGSRLTAKSNVRIKH